MADKPNARTAAVLLIGNELLNGKVQDENLFVLAKTLGQLGIRVRRVITIPDEIDVISSEVKGLSEKHHVVFTSGGVGPTHDDLTVEGVARAFGVPVVESPAMAAMLRGHYRERCNAAHLRMALIPEGAELTSNADVAWPTIVMRNVWLLPGIPEVFRMKLSHVRERLGGGTPFVSRAVYTKLDEGELKPLLDAVVAMHPEVEVGSYPKWSDPSYRTKLTFDGQEAELVGLAVETFLKLLPAGEPQRVD
jgi:molybdenum cofactor synthesis domain-containing protein